MQSRENHNLWGSKRKPNTTSIDQTCMNQKQVHQSSLHNVALSQFSGSPSRPTMRKSHHSSRPLGRARGLAFYLLGGSLLFPASTCAQAGFNPGLQNPGLQQQQNLLQLQQIQMPDVQRSKPAPLIQVIDPSAPLPTTPPPKACEPQRTQDCQYETSK